MIPQAITEDLRNGMGLEECLIKHETNLKTLFSKEYPDEIRCDPKWKYIEKRGSNYYIKKKIDWTITNNGFTAMAMWLMFLILGLIGGRTLTLKEVKK